MGWPISFYHSSPQAILWIGCLHRRSDMSGNIVLPPQDLSVKVIKIFPGQHLFEKADSFCRGVYYEKGILQEGGKFPIDPHIYFMGMKENSIVATMGGFRKDSSAGEFLPLEHIFDIRCPDRGVELGRVSITTKRIKEKKKVLLAMITEATGYFGDANYFVETTAGVKSCFEKLGVIFYPRSAPLKPDKIPPQSRGFYESENAPKVFRVSP